jgi:hypothetical protein
MPKTYAPKTDRKNRSHKPQTLPATFKAGFLASLDKRTDLAKALRQNYDDIVKDIGGADEVGHVKAALIERFCWLETILQSIEHEMVSGETSRTEAIGRWIQAVNSLSGLAKVLGVERKTSNLWSAIDTPSINKEQTNGS